MKLARAEVPSRYTAEAILPRRIAWTLARESVTRIRSRAIRPASTRAASTPNQSQGLAGSIARKSILWRRPLDTLILAREPPAKGVLTGRM